MPPFNLLLRHREAALAALAVHISMGDLDCFAEFTPASEPGLAMTLADIPGNASAGNARGFTLA